MPVSSRTAPRSALGSRDNWHRCACCTKPIAPGKLLCTRHWHQLPDAHKSAVSKAWRSYRAASSRNDQAGLHARADYLRAREQAVAALQAQLAPVPEPTHPADQALTTLVATAATHPQEQQP